MALRVLDLRCERCGIIEPRPAPALTVPEAAALLRSHRCDASPREVWVQPVNWARKPKALREMLECSVIVRRSPGRRASTRLAGV